MWRYRNACIHMHPCAQCHHWVLQWCADQSLGMSQTNKTNVNGGFKLPKTKKQCENTATNNLCSRGTKWRRMTQCGVATWHLAAFVSHVLSERWQNEKASGLWDSSRAQAARWRKKNEKHGDESKTRDEWSFLNSLQPRMLGNNRLFLFLQKWILCTKTIERPTQLMKSLHEYETW